ncbi:MAG: DUF4194 domain-containing protein [Gammaproteobacteria bacterium]|nr:DUF4194 domain-containing protein [Gammaproteobacteria bacterium]
MLAELKQQNFEAQQPTDHDTMPRLMRHRTLSYPVSLLCLLLRKYLLEQDVSGGELRPIINHHTIVEQMRIYLPEKTNEARVADQISTAIQKIIDLGFLRPLQQTEKNYEIQRILKAFIDAEWLSTLNEKLTEYQNYEHDVT